MEGRWTRQSGISMTSCVPFLKRPILEGLRTASFAFRRVDSNPSVIRRNEILFFSKKATAPLSIGGLYKLAESSQPEQLEKWGHVGGLFISCLQVVQRLSKGFGFVQKERVLNRPQTSCEHVFSA